MSDFNSHKSVERAYCLWFNDESNSGSNSKYESSKKRQIQKAALPANLDEAQRHGISKRIFKKPNGSNPDNNESPSSAIKYSFFCDPEELLDLGASIPLIFKLTNILILTLVFVSALASIPCLVDNAYQGQDPWTHEKSFNLITPSTFGEGKPVSSWQPVLHITACAVLAVLYLWIVRKIKGKSIDLDTRNTKPANFTLMVMRLPEQYTLDQLKNHVEVNFSGAEVVSVVTAYDIVEYMNYTKEIADWKLKRNIATVYSKKYFKYLKIKICCKTFEYNTDVCDSMIKKLKDQQKANFEKIKSEKLSEFAFVTVSSQIQARKIAEKWSKPPGMCFNRRKNHKIYTNENIFNSHYVHAEMAPDHSDVNWENLGISTFHRRLRMVVTVFIALFTLCFACVIMAGTAAWKMKVKNNKDNETADNIRAATIIPTLVSVIINVLVARLTRKFSNYERHITWTHYNRSVFRMLIMFVLLNNIGIPLAVYSALDQDWFSAGGLAYTVFWLEIMNSFLSPLIFLINPTRIFRWIKRYKYKREENSGELIISQKTAEEAFEGPDVNLPDRFANILKNFTMSLFYAPIVPVGTLIAICGLIIELIVFKYMLLRVCSRPEVYSSDLVLTATKWIKCSILLYSLGIVIFYTNLVSDLLILEILFFSIICVYFIIPTSVTCKCCFQDNTLEKFEEECGNDEKYTNYFSHLKEFRSDYERENPITAEDGINKWEKFNKDKNKDIYLKSFRKGVQKQTSNENKYIEKCEEEKDSSQILIENNNAQGFE